MITIEMSSPKYTPYGRIVRNMMYGGNGNLDTMFFGMFVYGCPDNGGEHTLCLRGSNQDVIAFFELHHERTIENGLESPFQCLIDYINTSNHSKFNAVRILNETGNGKFVTENQ